VDLRVEQQKRNMKMPDSFEHDSAIFLTNIMRDIIISKEISVIGINCLYSGLFPVVMHLAKSARKINPNIKVVIGGIHPTIYAEQILNHYSGDIDYVVLGEGESSFVELLYCLEANLQHDIALIDGLGYWIDDTAVINSKTKFVEYLDELPFPAVDLLNITDYYTDTSAWHNPKRKPINTPVPILSSRSCPKCCNFCSMHLVHGKKIRFRSPENVVKEMKMYRDTYGLTYFNITDDNLTLHKQNLMKLMGLIISEKLDIQFSTENGVYINNLDEEVLDAMTAAGLARLHLAFETGSDYIRNQVIGKNLYNTKINEISEIISKEKYNHVFLYGYFVIGLPEETEETLEETFELIKSFPLDNYSLFYAIPVPGTKLYDQCLRDKLFVQDYFYDVDSLVSQVNVGQMVNGLPNIQPYNLQIPKLVEFKNKAMDYLSEKRSKSSVPMSSPLRLCSPNVLLP
jgi:magnesium-protoporphyrin IX monomethyl ester (oxidative) cyclase